MSSPSKTERRRPPGTDDNAPAISETETAVEADEEKKARPPPRGIVQRIKASLTFLKKDASAAFVQLVLGGQLGYFLVGSIYVGVTEAVLPTWATSLMDGCFTPEGSVLRQFVSSIQLVIRTAVCASTIIGGFIFFIVGLSALGGAGWFYAYLNSPSGNLSLLLKHRPDISLTFLLGTFLGFIIPYKVPFIGENGIYLGITMPISCAGLLWKAHEENLKAERKKKKEEENKSLLGKVKNTLSDAVVGEVTVDGASSDIKLGDVVGAITNDPTKKWMNTVDSPHLLGARVCAGLSYGVALYLGWFYVTDFMFPFLTSLFYGERSFIFRYFFEGLRKSLLTPEVAAETVAAL